MMNITVSQPYLFLIPNTRKTNVLKLVPKMDTKSSLSPRSLLRVKSFLDIYKNESKEIRDELANILPFYNRLITMRAQTFEEFALLRVAERNHLFYEDPLFSYENVLPPCPFCDEEKRILRIRPNEYRCYRCKKKYAANYRSLTSETKSSSLVWLQILHCLIEQYSIEKTCHLLYLQF